jgi:hypothetical protein
MKLAQIIHERATVAGQVAELRETMPPLPQKKLSIDKHLEIDETGRFNFKEKSPGAQWKIAFSLAPEEFENLVAFIKEHF